jgi:hypothetical protein
MEEGSVSDYIVSYTAATLTIVEKATRTLAFGSNSIALSFGDIEPLSANFSAGTEEGTVLYSHGVSTACLVDSSTGIVTVTAPSGVCEVSASAEETPGFLATATITSVTVTVSARLITLTGDDVIFAYGLPITSSHSVSAGALLAGDEITDVTYVYQGVGSTTYPASTTPPLDAGTYSVTPSAAVGLNANYDIRYASGTLTISAPAPPNVVISMEAPVGAPVIGSEVTYEASGLRAGTAFSLVVRSTPQTLASGIAHLGAVSGTAEVPDNLESGWHSLTFTSADPGGSSVTEVLYFKLSESGALLETSSTRPLAELSSTGATSVIPSTWAALLLLLLGAGMVAAGTRRRARRTGI